MKTLIELVGDYDAYQKSLGHSERTRYTGRANLVRFVRWLAHQLGVETVDRLRVVHLERWRQSLTEWRTRAGLPLKPAGLNRHLVSVRGFLHYLARHGLVAASLADALVYMKEPRRLPTSVLDHAAMRKLLAQVPTSTARGYRNRAMLELLYSTGIRAAELLSLNVDDVQLAQRMALVHGKGNKDRMVPIGRTALRHLETYLKAVRPFLVRDPNESALFVNERGKRISYEGFRRILKAALSAASTAPVTAHTFRRTCATELIRGGANMYHVKELLGHESLDTLKHYVRLTIHDLKKTHAKCHPRERDEPPSFL